VACRAQGARRRAEPLTRGSPENLDALGKVDVILITHGHGDHIGDVKALAERTGAPVLGPAGLIAALIDLGWVSPALSHG